MILFEDGRQFQIAGDVLSDGTTVIPFSAISLGEKPSSFPIPVIGVLPPILYVELIVVGDGTFLTAMSITDYNRLAIAESNRTVVQPVAMGLLQRAAQSIRRTCGSCGRN